MVKRTKRTTHITRETADRFSQTLDNLPAKPKTKLTPKELIFENLNQLNTALEKGYDYDDLVSMLATEGVKLSAATLRQYLSEARRTAVGQTVETANVSASEKKVAPPKSDRTRQSTKETTEPLTERTTNEAPANVTQLSPENRSPNTTKSEHPPPLPSPSETSFDDDPELVEMADVL